MFGYGEKGAFEITLYLFRKYGITGEMVRWYGLELAYADCPAYHSEWQFDGPNVCRQVLLAPSAVIGYSFLLMQDNARSHTDRPVENCLEAETIQRRE
ncbi:hypothetical protein TNCV_4474561 [Trichonephila clavipes]|nr:hypothetical protein TNCV_4474561 [Trichonephila clavipes]